MKNQQTITIPPATTPVEQVWPPKIKVKGPSKNELELVAIGVKAADCLVKEAGESK